MAFDLIECHRVTRPATLFTILLATPLIFFTDVEYLAALATMCFMVCYGFTNLACFLLTAFIQLNWRPKYHVPSYVSATGCLACLLLMFQIQWYTGLLGFMVSSILNCSLYSDTAGGECDQLPSSIS
jgi:hypothetical protein